MKSTIGQFKKGDPVKSASDLFADNLLQCTGWRSAESLQRNMCPHKNSERRKFFATGGGVQVFWITIF